MEENTSTETNLTILSTVEQGHFYGRIQQKRQTPTQ